MKLQSDIFTRRRWELKNSYCLSGRRTKRLMSSCRVSRYFLPGGPGTVVMNVWIVKIRNCKNVPGRRAHAQNKSGKLGLLRMTLQTFLLMSERSGNERAILPTDARNKRSIRRVCIRKRVDFSF